MTGDESDLVSLPPGRWEQKAVMGWGVGAEGGGHGELGKKVTAGQG